VADEKIKKKKNPCQRRVRDYGESADSRVYWRTFILQGQFLNKKIYRGKSKNDIYYRRVKQY